MTTERKILDYYVQIVIRKPQLLLVKKEKLKIKAAYRWRA